MIIAIDTGGTKTLVAAFEADGSLRERVKFPTPRDQTEYIDMVVREAQELLSGGEPEAISVALPGVIREQVAVVCKNLNWHNFDVLAELKSYWPEVPMYLENDANLGAVGAARLTKPLPHKLLYLTISTGVGGGVVIDGGIDTTLTDAEFGDQVLEYNGRLTDWERIASGRALFSLYPEELTDATDAKTKQEIARRIARGLLALLPVLRPDVVAFGGGLGAKYHLLEPFLHQELATLPPQYLPDIITAPYPEEIVIYGCYYHALAALNA